MNNPYKGPIIDPHHHLWDLRMHRHPWLAPPSNPAASGDKNAPLRRNYLVEDYLADAADQNIVGTVHVEAAWLDNDCLGETRWLESLDKETGIARRYVAHVSLQRPDAHALVEAQADIAPVVGIRDILSWHRDPALTFRAERGVMDDPAWRSGLRSLKQHELAFDLMIFAGQLDDALRLATDFPDQQFVLNHTGSPIDRDDEALSGWRTGISRLSRAANVAVKISALTGYDPDWTVDRIRPFILHCIDAFGSGRCMFASDFPVTGLHATFAETYSIYREVTADFSKDEQAALFFGTAQRVYRFT